MQELGDYYMDVKLAGGHWQCDGEDGTCDEMNAEIEWAEKDAGERSNDFKYVFDVSTHTASVLHMLTQMLIQGRVIERLRGNFGRYS
jgi:hypothetical protein